MGLIALAASSFAIAEDAPKKAADKEAAPKEEAPKEAAPKEDAPKEVIPDLAEIKGDASYALGFRVASDTLAGSGLTPDDIELEAFTKGFSTALAKKESEIATERLQAAMTSLGAILQQREKKSAEKNVEVGKKFLEENGKRKGVVTTKSGLQYEVLEKGGESKYVAPKEGEPEKQFMVNYKGTLIDGTTFDASPEGQPVPMTMQVIPGFQEALKAMPIGAKWKLFIPSELAYGAERRSAQIAPNSVLIFELELKEIKDAPPAPEGGGFPVAPPQGE